MEARCAEAIMRSDPPSDGPVFIRPYGKDPQMTSTFHNFHVLCTLVHLLRGARLSHGDLGDVLSWLGGEFGSGRRRHSLSFFGLHFGEASLPA